MTAASSQFDLANTDLTRYQKILDILRELDIEIEDTLELLPVGASQRDDPRFSKTRRNKDLDDEHHHVAKLSPWCWHFQISTSDSRS